MKELTLEILLHWFANDGNISLIRDGFGYENVETKHCELAFNHTTKEWFVRYRGVKFSLSEIQLYARPISDLTKEEFKEKLKSLNYRTDENGIQSIISDVKQGVAQYDLMKMLLKNHFNVFNLEPHLWVNINDLK